MKKLFCIAGTQLRCIFRRRGWCVLLVLGLVSALACFWYPYAHHVDAVALMGQTVYGQVVLTICFMAMGIELRRESRQEHVDGLIAAYARHPAFFPSAQIIALAFAAAVVTLILCAGFLTPLLIDGAHPLWVRQTLLQTVLLYFLPCFLYGVAGLLFSHWIPGKNVYIAVIAFWLPTSSLAVYFTGNLGRIFPGWRLFFNFINLGLNDYRAGWNFVTGPPIELPRWVVRITACLFAVCLYVTSCVKDALSERRAVRRAKRRVGAVVICGVLALSLLCARYRVFFTQFANDLLTTSLTFDKSQEYETSSERPAEKTIPLHKTDISLTCTTQGFAAEVILTATADSTITEQAFTLFSDLEVEEVLVEGEKAACERVHDSLNVRFPAPKSAGEEISFTFRYHGFGLPTFPVNETPVQLGHSFPWLPWPGVRTRSKTEIVYYDQGGAFCVADWQQGDPVQYTLHYRGPENLYTNLTDMGGGLYEGISTEGVTLYSGMVHSHWQGVDVYIPPALYSKGDFYASTILSVQPLLRSLCERMGTPKLPEAPSALIVFRSEEPVWGTANPANELFARGSAWEMHLPRTAISEAAWHRRDAGSTEAFQSSVQVLADIGIPYLFSRSAGYPAETPWFSNMCLVDLLRLSILTPEMDLDDVSFHRQMFCGNHFYIWDKRQRQEVMEEYGVSLPDTPVEESARQLEAILGQMHEGNTFETQLRALYQRLLRGEGIAPAEMVQILYDSIA